MLEGNQAERQSEMIEKEMTAITANHFLTRLSEKVSSYNARLLLNSAMVESGLHETVIDAPLAKEDAKTLCLKLIKKGGPAFHVGQSIYREVQ